MQCLKQCCDSITVTKVFLREPKLYAYLPESYNALICNSISSIISLGLNSYTVLPCSMNFSQSYHLRQNLSITFLPFCGITSSVYKIYIPVSVCRKKLRYEDLVVANSKDLAVIKSPFC